MAISAAFLRTRVARRIFGLFLLCALLPVGALAVISYLSVAGQLDGQSRARVEASSKTAWAAILERLQNADADLTIVASRLAPRAGGYTLEEGVLARKLGIRYRALAVQRGDGSLVPLFERIDSVPQLSDSARTHLQSGQSIVTSRGSFPDAEVFIARAVDPNRLSRGILWVDYHPARLGAGDELEGLPTDIQMCLFNEVGVELYCSGPRAPSLLEQVRVLKADETTEPFEWNDGRDDYVAAARQIFLKVNYLVPTPWTAVMTESKGTILAPLKRFQIFFLPVLLMALWVVLLLSNVQIRRSMEPLEKLKEGTQYIAARDFDHPVEVHSKDEFEDLATSFNSMAQRLGRQFNALTAINEIDRAVLSKLETENIVDTVLSRTREVVGCDGVSLSLARSHGAAGRWRLIAADGTDGKRVEKVIRLSEADVQQLRDHPEFLTLNGDRQPSYTAYETFAERGMHSFLVLPMFVKQQIAGAISLGYVDAPPVAGDDDLVQARQLADQVAVALSQASLIKELDDFNWGALAALAQTVDAKSPWTGGHSERVTRLSLSVGVKLGLSREDLDVLHRGGLLHDIGKIGVPATILDKPGRLTDEEWEVMRGHVTMGARILKPIAAYSNLIPIVLYHHERFDGSGYPEGLAGEDIPFLARLLAVPDVFDALSSDRPYRSALPRPKAVAFIAERSGTEFDPRVTDAFLQVMNEPQAVSQFQTFPLIPNPST